MSENKDLWGPLNSPNDPSSGKASEKKSAASKKTEDAPRSKTPFYIAGGVATLLLALVLGITLTGDDSKEKVEKKETTTTEETGAKEWWQNEDASIPTKVEDWQKEEDSAIDPNEITKLQEGFAERKLEGTDFKGYTFIGLPSEEQGWTSDPDETFTEEGLPNPYWVSNTAEDVNTQSTLIAERLLNPIYGGWGNFQFPIANPKVNLLPQTLGEIWTQKYLKKHANAKDNSFLPVYADWNNNDYGMKDTLLPEGASARWFGQITSANLTVAQDPELFTNIYKVEYDVTFDALTQTKDVVSKNGKLQITFVANPERLEGNENVYGLLIDDAKLTVKN